MSCHNYGISFCGFTNLHQAVEPAKSNAKFFQTSLIYEGLKNSYFIHSGRPDGRKCIFINNFTIVKRGQSVF